MRIILFIFSLLLILCNCEIIKATITNRTLSKKGFHRKLHTSIKFDGQLESKDCSVGILEYFPNGVYVDIYELDGLRRWMQKHDPSSTVNWHVFNEKVDLEKPARVSPPVLVALYTPFKELTHFEVPIHFRYQDPSSTQTHASVTIDEPRSIFLTCNGQLSYNDLIKQLHLENEEWVNIPKGKVLQVDYNKVDPIHVSIPVGNLNDYHIVQKITLGTTIVGAILIILISLMKK